MKAESEKAQPSAFWMNNLWRAKVKVKTNNP
jgi:hypothetical protein